MQGAVSHILNEQHHAAVCALTYHPHDALVASADTNSVVRLFEIDENGAFARFGQAVESNGC